MARRNKKQTCSNCSNQKICKYLEDFATITKRVKEITQDSEFIELGIYCKYWKDNGKNLEIAICE